MSIRWPPKQWHCVPLFESRHSLINALALSVMMIGRNNLAVQLYEPVNQPHLWNHSKIIRQTYTYSTTLYSAIGQPSKSTKFVLLPDTRFKSWSHTVYFSFSNTFSRQSKWYNASYLDSTTFLLQTWYSFSSELMGHRLNSNLFLLKTPAQHQVFSLTMQTLNHNQQNWYHWKTCNVFPNIYHRLNLRLFSA